MWATGGPLDIPLPDCEQIFEPRRPRRARGDPQEDRRVQGRQPGRPAAGARAERQASPDRSRSSSSAATPNNRGPAVPRQVPGDRRGPNRKPFTDGSGRLELAKAIASPDNPLTARVMVNRVWAGHFGHGLVRTPSDFGVRSDPPTHPELLDWLAVRFVKDGWSVKQLHKLIMLSATYQQSSAVSAEMLQARPGEPALSHQNRRRLDFEALRDSLLSVAGKLDLDAGRQAGRSVQGAVQHAAQRLRPDRPHELPRHVPGVRRRQPGHTQPAAVPDDRAATGAVPDEQPVRDRSRRRRSRRGPRLTAREDARRRRSTRCTGSRWAASPTAEELRPGAGVRDRTTTAKAGVRPVAATRARCCSEQRVRVRGLNRRDEREPRERSSRLRGDRSVRSRLDGIAG